MFKNKQQYSLELENMKVNDLRLVLKIILITPLRKTEYEGINDIKVAEDKVQKCAFVNTVMNIRISQQRGIC
jgi:hypothetical protein